MQLIGESVAAASGTKFESDFFAYPGTRPNWVPKWGFKTDAPTFDPRFDIGGQFGGWHYGVKAYAGYGGEPDESGEAKRGPDVNAYCDFAGVHGTGIFVTGVAGTSVNNIGVYGQTGEDPDSVIPEALLGGVVGASRGQHGVVGWSEGGAGVYGKAGRDPRMSVAYSPAGVSGASVYLDGVSGWSSNSRGVVAVGGRGGVIGASVNDVGVFGSSNLNVGVQGLSGSYGPSTFPDFSTSPAVLGTSDQSVGVVGASNALMGVYGFSTGNAGVVGRSASPLSFGGYFFGNVHIQGTVSYGFTAAVVAFPDGTQRVLHGMESPDHWFEDFGTTRLKRGRAVVKIDADFAKVIKRGDYRVFVTPEGNCRGLYVHRKRAASFEVRELAGGKSGVAFSYRIVGRRMDIKGHRRFAKIDTRLSLPAAATRPRRKGGPTAAELRTLVARLRKMPTRRAQRAKRGRTPRALRKRARA